MLRALALSLILLAASACTPGHTELVRHHTEDGVRAFARGSYGDARDCFKAALALKPGDADLLYNLGQCHERLGQNDQAEAIYRQCLAGETEHADARHAWVVLMVNTKREDEAKRTVVGWINARPRLAGPYVEDAWLRARDGDLDSARRRYQQALGMEPNNPRALTELAAIYEKLGRPDRALVLYERALEAKPGQPEIAKLVSRMRQDGVTGPRPD